MSKLSLSSVIRSLKQLIFFIFEKYLQNYVQDAKYSVVWCWIGDQRHDSGGGGATLRHFGVLEQFFHERLWIIVHMGITTICKKFNSQGSNLFYSYFNPVPPHKLLFRTKTPHCMHFICVIPLKKTFMFRKTCLECVGGIIYMIQRVLGLLSKT